MSFPPQWKNVKSSAFEEFGSLNMSSRGTLAENTFFIVGGL